MPQGGSEIPPPLIPMPTLPLTWPTPSIAPEPDTEEMALVSPAGQEDDGGRDWVTIAGIVLVAEAALLWLAACAALARRRWALVRAERAGARE
jgi:hypothetical protein